MEFKNKNILILAPHTDDGELGCGATIHRAIREGAHVTYVAFSTAEESVPEGFQKNQLEFELKQATNVLGIPEKDLIIFRYAVRKLNYVRQEILEELIRLREKINPDMVFMPVLHDIHQDHSTVAAEGLRAFKHATILGYELIWNNLQFSTDCFVKVDQVDLERKCEALTRYETQRGRSYMDASFIKSLARVRGVQAGIEFAETFEVIRWMI